MKTKYNQFSFCFIHHITAISLSVSPLIYNSAKKKETHDLREVFESSPQMAIDTDTIVCEKKR